MRICGGFGLLTCAILVIAWIGAPIASAGSGPGPRNPTICTGPMSGVIARDLEVQTNCKLTEATVLGSVFVDPAATLETTTTTVRHDVSCAVGSTCTLGSSTQVAQDLRCSGATCTLTSSTVGHDLTCTDSQCALGSSTVEHRVTVEGVSLLDADASRLGELECNQAQSDLAGCNVYPGSVIERRLTVGAGSSVSVQQTTIGGDAKCDRCFSFDITDSTVLGSVILERGFIGNICNNEIGRNLTISRGTGLFFPCAGSRIGGNLEIRSNQGVLAFFGYTVNGNLIVTGNSASIDLFGNTVRQNIICSRNVPPPLGAGNTAKRIDRDCGPIGLPTEV